MGLGYHKKKLGSVRAWARNRCQYLDEQTFYRTLPEIHRLFHRYFGQLRHWEASYARAHSGGAWRVLRMLPDAVLVPVIRAAAGLSCEKDSVSPAA